MSELPSITGKKVLMVVASQNFRDEEYKEPREILEQQGAQIIVASSSSKKARGMLGLEIQPDRLLGNVKPEDYDAIIFVGGSGAREYWDNKAAHNLIKQMAALNKILGAICIAPVTLGRAGVLNGKKVTIFPSETGQLKGLGVTYTGKHVQRDGNIITADGPSAASEFGMAIVEALSNPQENRLRR